MEKHGGKDTKEEKERRGGPGNQCEGRAGCQTHRSVDLSIQHGSAEWRAPSECFRPFHNTLPGHPRIYVPGKFFHLMANVLFIWETSRPDCFHNPLGEVEAFLNCLKVQLAAVLS